MLAHFGSDLPTSRQAYARFVADGAGSHHSTDLSGGGLRRSLGWRSVPMLRRGRERWPQCALNGPPGSSGLAVASAAAELGITAARVLSCSAYLGSSLEHLVD